MQAKWIKLDLTQPNNLFNSFQQESGLLTLSVHPLKMNLLANTVCQQILKSAKRTWGSNLVFKKCDNLGPHKSEGMKAGMKYGTNKPYL